MMTANSNVRQTAVILIMVLLLTSQSGCRDPDLPACQPASRPVAQAAGIDRAQQPTELKNGQAAGVLPLPDIQALESELDQACDETGFSVWVVQPDEQAEDIFLIVAQDESKAKAFNCFFNWCFMNRGSPVLCIDRLFLEHKRNEAASSGDWTQPAVVKLLELSLKRVLDDHYDPGIPAFILDCYREEFRERQSQNSQQTITHSKVFGTLEVTYEASIISTVEFKRAADQKTQNS